MPQALNFDGPVIIAYDIETTNLGADMGVITTFAWRDIYNSKKTNCISIHETNSFIKRPWDDSDLLKKIYEVLLSADGVIAHYGDRFDMKFIKARLALAGLVLPHIPSIDTCLTARKHYRLQSNRLDNLADFFGITPKVKVSKEIWKRAQAFDIKALKVLKGRCIGDVDTLVELFYKMRPYCQHLNQNLFFFDPENGQRCTTCGGVRLVSNGYRATPQGRYLRLQCHDCGTWNKGKATRQTKHKRMP